MMLSLLSVVAVLGCLIPLVASAGPFSPPPPTLKYVSALFRHGPRSSLYRYYPTHETTDKHMKMFYGLRGVLTVLGKQRMYEVGQNLGARYRRFLGEYREDNVWVTSRGASRNVMTALSIMAGMLPPKIKIFEDIDWQPIPVFATRDDKSHIFHDLEFKKLEECPKQKFNADRLTNEVLEKEDWKNPLWRLLRASTGNDYVTSVASAYQIYDSLHSEYLNGLPLPAWALEKQPNFNDLPLYPTVLRKAVEEWRKDDLAKRLLNILIGPYFYTLKSKLKRKSLEPDFTELMHLHVTEDTTLIALLNVLEIKEPNAFEPGNGLIIELHNDQDLWFVKFFIYDSLKLEDKMYEVMPSFIESSVCPLSSLLGVILSPTWEDSCGF